MPVSTKAEVHFDVTSFMNYPQLNPARLRQGLRRVGPLLANYPVEGPLIAARHTAALAATQKAFELNRRWKREQGATMHGPDAREVDRVVDAAVTGLHGMLEENMLVFPQGSAKHEAAKRLLALFFPNELADVVQVTYVEEQAALDDILALARDGSGDWTADVQALGLQEVLTRIAELNTEYEAVITRPTNVLGFEVVKAASRVGHQLTVGIIALICGMFPSDSPEDAAAREKLLTPFVDQRREAALYRQRRAKGGVIEDEDELFDEDLGDDPFAGAASEPNAGGASADGSQGAPNPEPDPTAQS